MYIISNTAVSSQEQKGRDIYKSIFTGMTWTPMVEKYDRFDLSGNTSSTHNAIIKKSNVNQYVEVKVRNLRSTDYTTTFLESKKHFDLMYYANQTTTGKAFYFVAFNDATALLFDLKGIKNIEQYKVTRSMREVTLENQTKVVDKEIYDLPLSLAKKYKF